MNKIKTVRTRFAPSPTGHMHLGNARTALFNFLFAKNKHGSFALRIEDTDRERNQNESTEQIFTDLDWLGLKRDEGPKEGGHYRPYLQSQRTDLYKEALETLILNNSIYRCFCTEEKLKEEREKQAKAGNPPRYARTCLAMPPEKVKQKIEFGTTFIWRFKLNDKQRIEFNDLARGKMAFDLANFSDFSLTRSDGSFTFIFTNFVDDWKMKISHAIRGEDHLSNTALQAVLYYAFSVTPPTFWHLPLLCDENGNKLSKRSKHFSLEDLKHEGFLAEAICNYLALIGHSFENEIQSLSELCKNYNFDKLKPGNAAHFDIKKLEWVNHQWMARLTAAELAARVKPFLKSILPEKFIHDEKLASLVSTVKGEAKTLSDFKDLLAFYFHTPDFSHNKAKELVAENREHELIKLLCTEAKGSHSFSELVSNAKSTAKEKNFKPKETFSMIRYILTGSPSGLGMDDLGQALGHKEVVKRICRQL
jgi:nondiscriminating glutamyl-tRNA synthetase